MSFGRRTEKLRSVRKKSSDSVFYLQRGNQRADVYLPIIVINWRWAMSATMGLEVTAYHLLLVDDRRLKRVAKLMTNYYLLISCSIVCLHWTRPVAIRTYWLRTATCGVTRISSFFLLIAGTRIGTLWLMTDQSASFFPSTPPRDQNKFFYCPFCIILHM